MRGYHRYRWQLAQKKYERRMKVGRHYLKFTDEMNRTVRMFIVYGQYSPEQIFGRFRLKGEEMVCAETIYRWIWQEKRRDNDEMVRNLRHRGRRKRRRDSLYSSKGIIQDRVDISLRPSVVEEKRRFGDFEIDTDWQEPQGCHLDDERLVHVTTERNSPAIRRLRRDSMPSSTSHAHTTLGSGV